MFKLFTASAVFFSVTAFSSAVIAHSLAIPHSHDSVMLFDKHYWTLGIIGLAALTMFVVRTINKSK